jgi:hypothetical protein
MMREFKGRPVIPGNTEAVALVSKNGFNTLASYQKSLMFGDEKGTCSDQNNPDIYGKAHLEKTGATLGTREGRIVVGDYVLTEEDYLARRVFPDEIARNCYEFDSHDLRKKGSKAEYEAAYTAGESHGIPYRCLTPKTLKNVLVAGKCISAERRVMGSVRIMATCLSTGEAAGMAGAFALGVEGCDVHAVDTDKLRLRLKEVGAYIL